MKYQNLLTQKENKTKTDSKLIMHIATHKA